MHTGFPRLTFIDMLGLVFAVLLVSLQLAPIALEQQVLLVVMTASGLVTWLFMAQFKSLVTVLTRVNYRMLAVPVSAALLTLVVYGMLSGGAYPVVALATFAGFWTLWMLGARAFYQRHRPVLRTLVIGNPSFARELAKLPQLATQRLDAPPDSFDDFDIVVLDPVKLYDRDWLQWLSHADMAGLKIIAAPLVFETLEKRIPLEMLHGRWAYAIFNGQSGYAFWKRVLDIVIVTLAAPFLLLLAGVIALVVLFDSGRPVLFWQRRVGQDGAPFMMVKFRTMRPDAEAKGEAFAAERDPRVTRIGAFLRKFRLDEIPQFYNVLKGEMSIIGPRPEQEGFAQRFVDEIPLYKLRYNVKPGITGWAQVMNGYAAGTEETREKLRYDFYYIKYFSFELDMQVVLRTIRIVLTGFGAR
jgi:lipopolysaccharide/colanic/teichoic acid biosynthesis glycosyltransferase